MMSFNTNKCSKSGTRRKCCRLQKYFFLSFVADSAWLCCRKSSTHSWSASQTCGRTTTTSTSFSPSIAAASCSPSCGCTTGESVTSCAPMSATLSTACADCPRPRWSSTPRRSCQLSPTFTATTSPTETSSLRTFSWTGLYKSLKKVHLKVRNHGEGPY